MNDTTPGILSEKISYTRGHKKDKLFVREIRKDYLGKKTDRWHGPYQSKDLRDRALYEFQDTKYNYAQIKNVTLKEALNDYLIKQTPLNKKENYGDSHKRSVKLFHELLNLQDINLADIEVSHVTNFEERLRALGKTNDVIKRTLGALNTIAIKSGGITGIDLNGLFSSKRFNLAHQPKDRYALSMDEVDAMYDFMERNDWPYRHAFRFVTEVGLRPGELFAIKHSDIGYNKEVDLKTVRIDKSITLAGPKQEIKEKTFYFKPLKTGKKANRTMYLSNRAKRYLDDHIQLDKELRQRYNGDYEKKYDLAKGNIQGYPHYKKSLLAFVIDTYKSNQEKIQDQQLNYDQIIDIETQAIQTVAEYEDLVFTRMPFLKHEKVIGSKQCKTFGWPLNAGDTWNAELKHYAKLAGVTETITKYNLRHTAFANMFAIKGFTIDELMKFTMHTSASTLRNYAVKYRKDDTEQIASAQKMNAQDQKLGLV